MKRIFLLAVLTAPLLLTGGIAAAQVTSGAVIRGLTLPGIGIPGTKAAATCNFSRDPVDHAGRLTGSSVNCGPGGSTGQNILGLPLFFNAYCVTTAPLKGVARLLQAPVLGNPNHCDLSGITRKNATKQFKGAIWR